MLKGKMVRFANWLIDRLLRVDRRRVFNDGDAAGSGGDVVAELLGIIEELSTAAAPTRCRWSISPMTGR